MKFEDPDGSRDFLFLYLLKVKKCKKNLLLGWLMPSLCLLMFVPGMALAKYVAVLETVAGSGAKEAITREDLLYLTDVLRGQAVRSLPAEQNFTIMTRENINVMLPPGKSIEECEGSCLAETGRNIAADYVAQAHISKVGGELAISAEIYETAGNKFLDSFHGRGSNVGELEALIKSSAPSFFRKVKGSAGWGGVSGFGDITSGGSFSYAGTKKYVVQIETSPEGAVPTVDGKGLPKCTSTPCKVQLEEGEHRFVVSKEHYEDAELVVEVNSNNQVVSMKLPENFGVLALDPEVDNGDPNLLTILVDGVRKRKGKIKLDPGVHSVSVQHPCYDPLSFSVGIERGKTQKFSRPLSRGVGGLSLETEWRGEPHSVPVYIDGKNVGSTPYEGEVPLCARVSVGNPGDEEIVPVELLWHEVVSTSYRLKKNPVTSKRLSAEEGSPKPAVSERQLKKHRPHWVIFGISTGFVAYGAAFALISYLDAKNLKEQYPDSFSEYEDNKSKIRTDDILNKMGWIAMIVGAVGVTCSIAF